LEFDEHLTSRARLSVIACLVQGKPLTFTELRTATGLADGNLHVQTGKLAEAGYIEVVKVMKGKRSLTRFRLTELGLESLKLHIRKLQSIVATESGEIRPKPGSTRRDDSQVWSG
jgi:DNA-binding MarR family transcriptional regulator